MVQAIVDLGEYQNRIIQIIKGKFGLKTKSEAVNLAIKKYGDEMLEPELRPEYVRNLQKIKEQKGARFKSIEELKKHVEDA